MRGSSGLVPTADTARAIEGIVLLDLSIDIAGRSTLVHLGRTAANNFPAMLNAIPELGVLAADLETMHRVRNLAQHQGVAPPPASRSDLLRTGTDGLTCLFQLCGQSFELFSSIPQLTSEYFKKPLAQALTQTDTRPANAVALAMMVLGRLRGWAEHVAGDAIVPDAMRLQVRPRWSDSPLMVACADGREESVDALLKLMGATVLRIDVPAWIRLQIIGAGHHARETETGWQYDSEPESEMPTLQEARWVIETVARAALSLEHDWPEFVLVPDSE